MSSVDLSYAETSVLSRGLSFCPATGSYNEFQVLKDLDNFARSMRLREFFHDHPASNPEPSLLPSCKHWTPPTQRDKFLDIYIKAVQQDVIESYQGRRSFHRNLSSHEIAAIDKLRERCDIIIKPADKGGAIVIMNTSDYVNEAHRQLAHTSFLQAP